jgi:hypothetical protein
VKLKLFFFFIIITLFLQAQVGINTNDPKATLDISINNATNNPDGIIIPRLTIDEVENREDLYNTNHHSALIYVTGSPLGVTEKTKNIKNEGFHYYSHPNEIEDGRWIPISSNYGTVSTAAWLADESLRTVYLSISSDQNTRNSGTELAVTDEGNFSVGKDRASSTAILDIYSKNKGISLPNLTTLQRNNIQYPINGLLIFNVSENCFNYFDSNLNIWKSLCGTFPPAKFTLSKCNNENGNGPSSTLIQGKSLNTNDTYTIEIDVSQVGTYEIIARTTNGYSYIKSGIFTEVGHHQIVLDGQGTPINSNTSSGDEIKLTFNGIVLNNSGCQRVIVNNNTSEYTVYCNTIAINGEYLQNIPVTQNEYITVRLNITAGGNINIFTPILNGIRFSSGMINLPVGDNQEVRLYASGTPINTGPISFNITGSDAINNSCQIVVNVISTLGTLNNPGTSCDAIYNEGTRIDGLYWIGSSVNDKYKTLCDMVDNVEAEMFGKEVGGYTLIWSTSEKTVDDNNWWYNTGNMSFKNGWGRNVIKTENGVFNVNDFRIESTERVRWPGKVTRLVVTEYPSSHDTSHDADPTKRLLNLNFVPSNLISGNQLVTNNNGQIVTKGQYMGAESFVIKNADNGYYTINVGGYVTITKSTLHINSTYPFHWDLHTYGYFPPNTLPAAETPGVEILDGNWPFFANNDHEATGKNEPFGYCTNIVNRSVKKFWSGVQENPSLTLPSCDYNNNTKNGIKQTTVTPGTANGVEGKVMQWWVK